MTGERTGRYSETHVIAVIERLTARRLRAFVEAGCVLPTESAGERLFDEADLARLELLCELTEDFGLDDEALTMVMSLIDQLHGLRHELRSLLRAIDEEPEAVRARIRGAYRRGREG